MFNSFFSLSKRSLAFSIIISLLLISTSCGCEKKPDFIEKQSFYFDTPCSIRIYDMENATSDDTYRVIDDAFSQCAYFENIFSKNAEYSDISVINTAKGSPVTCHAETIELLEKAIAYSRLSEGAFDISIGALQNLWEFKQQHATKLPDESQITEALRHIDYRAISIDGLVVTLRDPSMQLDLGGIAKGYIADKLCDFLKEKGVTSAIINLGGNVACIGPHSGKQNAFTFGIETPFSQMNSTIGTISGSDMTAVTSGIYERYFEYDNKLYHHILDPATGYPAETDIAGVTIISSEGHSADCDALSTICLILGANKSLTLIDSLEDYDAVIVLTDGSIVTTEAVDFKQ